LAFAVWVTWNTGHIPGLRVVDPFPFILLALVVSCEGVLLSTFVLIKQNNMARAADQRNHLNLQIDILAEQEITRSLQMLQLICAHLEIPLPDEVKNPTLVEETEVADLANQVRQQLGEE
jgi:uncharacterized membrane protein